MIVVADTSPLNYLVLIDAAHLLPDLFDTVLIPKAAFKELNHPRTPAKVRNWISNSPSWIEVRSAAPIVSPILAELDPGEREAIQPALGLGLNTVLMDESEGRRVAESFRLEVRGTLGILERAGRMGKINFREALDKLDRAKFRLSPAVKAAFLRRNP